MDTLEEWAVRDLVISNKLNAVSNGIIMGNKAIMGSYLDKGVLVCPFNSDAQYDIARDYM